MNIETGGGTLVHEIVHPFMELTSLRARHGLTKVWAHSMNNLAMRTDIFAGLRIGVCRAYRKRYGQSKCRRSKS